MITDIQLGGTGDLQIEGNKISLFDRQEESIRQRLRIGLATVRGEWFLNTSKGLPLTSPSASQKGSQSVIDAYIKQFIEDFDGIQRLRSYSSELDGPTRRLFVRFSAITDSGEILSFSEAI